MTSLRCIVSGGSLGLGRVIADTLADNQHRVMVLGRNGERLRVLTQSRSTMRHCVADVLQRKQCRIAVDQTIDHWGGIDVVVNVVGVSDRGRIDELTSERLREVFDANVISALNMSIAAADALADSKGVVVNIGSLGGRVGARYLGGYVTAKHALSGLTHQLRLEWNDRGVHVGLISPGPIRRDDAGHRYDATAAASDMPDSAKQPGGGARLKGLDPQRVADAVIQMIHSRKPDIVLPQHLRYLIAIGHLFPRLGDWLLLKMTKTR